MSSDLEAAIERARNHVMTPEERFEQRVSFVYGQQDYDNPHSLTKEKIRQMLAESDGHPPCSKCAETAADAYARGCADQHERTKAEAVGIAQSMAALTSSHAAYTIAAAIEKMERPKP